MFHRTAATRIINFTKNKIITSRRGCFHNISAVKIYPICFSITPVTKPVPACCQIINTSEHWISHRGYAKGKDKKKEPKGKKKVSVDENLLKEVVDPEKLHTEYQKCIDNMKQDFIKHLSVRSNIGALDTLQVTHSGKEYTLQELAQIVKKNPKTVVVHMTTFPQAIQDVLKAIQESGLGLTPQQDGTTLYIPIPKMTKEHRENLSKNAKALFIKCRDSTKDVQNKFIKSLKNKTNVSEDIVFSAKEQITALCEHYVAEAEKLLKIKQTELIGDEK